tara:strand:- start:28 stop:1392 length:1365 start_codon:yes stop_codon:yes gene_type:complete
MENLVNLNTPDFSRLIRNRVPNLNEMATHTSNTIKIKTTYYWRYFIYLVLTYFIVCFILFTIFLYIIIRAKNKVKHPFWYSQPVYYASYSNFLYTFGYFYGHGIINHKLPKINRWTNYKNIEFISLVDIKAENVKTISEFIKTNYKDSEYEVYKYDITPILFLSYLVHHNSATYIGTYNDPVTNKLVGTITAHPLNINIRENGKEMRLHNDVNYENVVYYVDNLCVHLDHRGRKIAPELIETLYHKIRHTNYTTKVALFKRENMFGSFIQGLTVYRTNIYKIDKWFNTSFELTAQCNVLEITQQNIHLLYNFIYNNNGKFFDVFIYPDMTNMVELLNRSAIYIYMIMKGDYICSVFFFKDTATKYSEKKTVGLFGSINNEQTMEFQTQGFYHILEKIVKKYEYEMLELEEISHNKELNKYVIRLNTPIIISTITWFLYNYKFKTLSSEKVFILN